MPHLFGEDGRDRRAAATSARSFARACIAKEFTVLATGRTSPIIGWLRALARAEHERCGGPGVGRGRACASPGGSPWA